MTTNEQARTKSELIEKDCYAVMCEYIDDDGFYTPPYLDVIFTNLEDAQKYINDSYHEDYENSVEYNKYSKTFEEYMADPNPKYSFMVATMLVRE